MCSTEVKSAFSLSTSTLLVQSLDTVSTRTTLPSSSTSRSGCHFRITAGCDRASDFKAFIP